MTGMQAVVAGPRACRSAWGRALRGTPWKAWLLAALLLGAQALGLAHRVQHAPGVAPAPLAWVDAHEAGDPDCRLIDQLAHGDLLCAAAVAVPAALPAVRPVVLAARPALAAGPAAAYQARAPPRAARPA